MGGVLWWESPLKGEDCDKFFMQNIVLIDVDLSSPRRSSVDLSSPTGGKTLERAMILIVFSFHT